MTVKQKTLNLPPTKQSLSGFDGNKLKTTTPPEVQKSADSFFAKKEALGFAKSNLEKSADELLAVMGKLKITQVTVKDAMGYTKRILIRTGADKLKVVSA